MRKLLPLLSLDSSNHLSSHRNSDPALKNSQKKESNLGHVNAIVYPETVSNNTIAWRSRKRQNTMPNLILKFQ